LKNSSPSTNSFTRPSRYGRDEPSRQSQGAYSSGSRGAYSSQSKGAYSSQSRGAYSSQSKGAYSSSTNSFTAMKKEPKKEFSSKDGMFPTLEKSEEVKKETTETPTLDFTSAIKRKKKTKKKWEGTRMEAKPGWVVLYCDENGIKQREYGEGATEHAEPSVPNRDAILRGMVSRWQEHRDYMNESHGSLSPYYGMKSLLDEPDEDSFDNWGENDADDADKFEDDYDGDY
jgi:hypothetical protein